MKPQTSTTGKITSMTHSPLPNPFFNICSYFTWHANKWPINLEIYIQPRQFLFKSLFLVGHSCDNAFLHLACKQMTDNSYYSSIIWSRSRTDIKKKITTYMPLLPLETTFTICTNHCNWTTSSSLSEANNYNYKENNNHKIYHNICGKATNNCNNICSSFCWWGTSTLPTRTWSTKL